MRFRTSIASRLRHEQGAVLILLAVLALALIVVAGFAIDTNSLTVTSAQFRFVADGAAAGAVVAYKKTGSYTEARKEAEKVIDKNKFLMEGFLESPRGAAELTVDLSQGVQGKDGIITPAIWHDAPLDTGCSGTPAPASPCPCLNGAWNGPCAEEVDPSDATKTPDAMIVNLKLREGSYLKSLFMKAVGQDKFHVQGTATARLKELHGVIVIDVSRSMAEATHLQYARVLNATAGEPTFPLQTTTCNSATDHTNICIPPPVGGCTFADGGLRGLYAAMWYSTIPAFLPNTRAGATVPTKHYRKDYGCYTLDTKDVGASGSQNRHYLVDAYSNVPATPDANTTYGPAPLSYHLHFINRLLTELENYLGPVKIGIIAFDSTAKMEARRFDLTLYDSTDSSNLVTELRDITNVKTPSATDIEKRYQTRGLFVREGGYTNLPEAIRDAHQMLKDDARYKFSNNFIVALSDGMTNCSTASGCGNTEAIVKEAVDEVIDYASTDLVPDGVRFHYLMSGRQAHTLMVKSAKDANQCMSDDEARSHDPAYLMTDATSNTGTYADHLAGKNSPFYYPTKLYQAVQASDGVWGVIRPCCKSGGACSDVRSTLDTSCKAGGSGVKSGTTNQPNTATNATYSDSDGRLQCEPNGESEILQAERFAKKVADVEPLAIVK